MKGENVPIDKPRACVDIGIFRRRNNGDQILLVTRGEEPFKGMLCLPGGVIREREQPEQAAQRKIKEEVNVVCDDLTLAFAISDPALDPRGWTVSCLYFCTWQLVINGPQMKPGEHEADVAFYPIDRIHLIENLVPGFAYLIGRLYEAWRRSP